MSLQYSGVTVIELTYVCELTVPVCVSAQEFTCGRTSITIVTAMIDLHREFVLYCLLKVKVYEA